MAPNHYGCESNAHSEFDCLAASYHRKGFTRTKWCAPCLARFTNVDEEE